MSQLPCRIKNLHCDKQSQRELTCCLKINVNSPQSTSHILRNYISTITHQTGILQITFVRKHFQKFIHITKGTRSILLGGSGGVPGMLSPCKDQIIPTCNPESSTESGEN